MIGLFGLKDFFGAKRRVGLVLGSGSARGLAHVGVIKAILERDIRVDMIAGSSIGALIGACYARTGKIADVERIVLSVDRKRLLGLTDPNLALMFKGFLYGEKVKELLRTILGDTHFHQLKIPLTVVATDADTGEEVLIREGSVLEAVRASISIPIVFMPVKLHHRFLIDGGISNPIPINVIRDMGANFIIASNVIQPPAKRKAVRRMADSNINGLQRLMNNIKRRERARLQKIDPNTPGIIDVLMQTIYTMEYKIVEMQTNEADILINPDTSRIASLDFHKGEEAIREGYMAAEKTLLRHWW